MQKLLKISLAILIIILLCYFPQYISHNQSKVTSSSPENSLSNNESALSDTSETISDETTIDEMASEEISSEEPSSEDTTIESTTVEQTTTEEITTNEILVPQEILVSNVEQPASLGKHDKNLMVYGDINPNSEDVIKLQQALQTYNKNISLAEILSKSSCSFLNVATICFIKFCSLCFIEINSSNLDNPSGD